MRDPCPFRKSYPRVGIDLEYTEAVPGQPNRAYGQSYNPLRKIPALVTDDGATIYDSTVICEYLDDLAGGGIIVPREASRRWRVLTNHALAQGLCDSVILIRYETWLRPEALRWSSWIDEHWDKIYSGLAWFDQNNTELGEPVNIAHLALGSLLGYIDFRWPHIVMPSTSRSTQSSGMSLDTAARMTAI
jgi:glutathione S-transferase